MLVRDEVQGNSPEQLLIALLVAIGVAAALLLLNKLLSSGLRRLARRTALKWDDILADVLLSTSKLLILLAGLYVGMQFVGLTPRTARLADHIAVAALWLQVGLWGNRAIRNGFRQYWLRNSATGSVATAASALTFLARLAWWALVVLLLLDHLGFNITTLITSLGIGGVAVALAVQNILGDIFASLSIALDKPFLVGEAISVDAFSGVVEQVGMKTTRLRATTGEELIFSNADLLKSRIRNHQRMTERCVQINFGVAHNTPAEVLAALPAEVREIVTQQQPVRFDRAHFKAISATSLDFEVVYFVLDPGYIVYMNIQQAINLDLVRHFEQRGIRLAMPSQTVYFGDARAHDNQGLRYAAT